MYYRDIIDALGHTPLVELSHLIPNEEVRILAKMEGQSVAAPVSKTG